MSSMPDDVVVNDINRSPGESLMMAREAQGFTQKTIADEMHLPVRYIQWIEEGAFEKLPSLVFARGYIRTYAKALGIDGAALIDMFDQTHGTPHKRGPIRSVSKVQEQVKLGDPVMRWSGWLFLVAIVAVTVWWWKTQYGITTLEELAPVSEAKVVEAEPVIQGSGNALPLPKISDPVESAEAVTQNNDVSQPSEEEPTYLSDEDVAKLQQELAANGKPGAVVEAVVSSEGLVINFIEDCWFSVKDADGKTLFNGIRKNGETATLSGKEPLAVIIGKASAVQKFSYNGKVIDLAPYSNKNVAKLTLPANQ